jgi:hypothetical protein
MAKTFTFFAEGDRVVAEGDRVEVRIVEFEARSNVDESDTVWLDSTVTVQAGAFIGSFKASFTTDDLVRLHEQLQSALSNAERDSDFPQYRRWPFAGNQVRQCWESDHLGCGIPQPLATWNSDFPTRNRSLRLDSYASRTGKCDASFPNMPNNRELRLA